MRSLIMHAIEIDDEVFEFLKENAEPFVDDPNSVLRKLLLGKPLKTKSQETKNADQNIHVYRDTTSASEFVKKFLQSNFGNGFHVRSPYRLMFESEDQIVYFQNFNKRDTSNLWYRLTKAPMNILRYSPKEAYVCLTNPAASIGYVIPLKEIDKKYRNQIGNEKKLK